MHCISIIYTSCSGRFSVNLIIYQYYNEFEGLAASRYCLESNATHGNSIHPACIACGDESALHTIDKPDIHT